jgi:hypothetical protein
MATSDLASLTGQSRTTLWRARQIGLLPARERQKGVKEVVYSADEVRRYLSRKMPHLLPRD